MATHLKAAGVKRVIYWGNLATMLWYEALKQRCPVKESDEVMRVVAESLYQRTRPLGLFDFRALPLSVLLVNGFHDFLMGGEQSPSQAGVPHVTFYGSGHFPHFEEPERFVDCLDEITPTGDFTVDLILHQESRFSMVAPSLIQQYRHHPDAVLLQSPTGLAQLFRNMNGIDFDRNGKPDQSYGIAYIGIRSHQLDSLGKRAASIYACNAV